MKKIGIGVVLVTLLGSLIYAQRFEIFFLLRYFKILTRYDIDLMPSNYESLSKDEARALLLRNKLDLDEVDFSEFLLRGKENTIGVMLKAGFDPKHVNVGLDTPVGVAVQIQSPEILRLLIENGVDINRVGSGNIPPLVNAARLGNAEIVQALVNAGADLNRFGMEARKAAYSEGKLDVLEHLIEYGPGKDTVISINKKSLLDRAIKNSRAMVGKILPAQGTTKRESPKPKNDEQPDENPVDVKQAAESYFAVVREGNYSNLNDSYPEILRDPTPEVFSQLEMYAFDDDWRVRNAAWFWISKFADCKNVNQIINRGIESSHQNARFYVVSIISDKACVGFEKKLKRLKERETDEQVLKNIDKAMSKLAVVKEKEKEKQFLWFKKGIAMTHSWLVVRGARFIFPLSMVLGFVLSILVGLKRSLVRAFVYALMFLCFRAIWNVLFEVWAGNGSVSSHYYYFLGKWDAKYLAPLLGDIFILYSVPLLAYFLYLKMTRQAARDLFSPELQLLDRGMCSLVFVGLILAMPVIYYAFIAAGVVTIGSLLFWSFETPESFFITGIAMFHAVVYSVLLWRLNGMLFVALSRRPLVIRVIAASVLLLGLSILWRMPFVGGGSVGGSSGFITPYESYSRALRYY